MKKKRHQRKMRDKKKIRRIIIGLKLSGVTITLLGVIFLIPGTIKLWNPDGIAWSIFLIMFVHIYKLLAIAVGSFIYMIGIVVQGYLL